MLLAPLWEPHFELPRAAGGMMKLFKKVGPESTGSIGWKAEQLTSDAAEQSARSGDTLVHDVITLRAGEEASASAAKYGARIGELAIPVLALHGADDPIASSGRTSALRGPKLEAHVALGARHDLLHDSSTPQTLARIAEWLDCAVPRG